MTTPTRQQVMLHIVAPTRRQAFAWCRENGEDPRAMRVITRPEQLWGLRDAEVIVVNRGAIVGPTEGVLDQVYEMEKTGHVRLRIGFTR